MSKLDTSIPKNSWVLIVGATSYVASHIIKQFLERGYRIRGTVRDASKVSWLENDLFAQYADGGDFELVDVPDLGADHAFDEAVRGVSAIVHVATVAVLSPDPNEVIPQIIASVSTILQAALKEPSVKRYVFTSSCAAAVLPDPHNKRHVERDTWNDTAVQLAWAPPPYQPERRFFIYMASKVAAEKRVWSFVAEERPHFSVNVVSPGTVLGEPLHENYVRSTGSWIPRLYNGEDPNNFNGLGSSEFSNTPVIVDVKDVALLHVAAVLDPEVEGARLQAWGRGYNWSEVLTTLRNLRPRHKFIPDLPNARHLGQSTDPAESFALLKKWAAQDGWRPLEETLADNLVFAGLVPRTEGLKV